jgi:hypothetical protein
MVSIVQVSEDTLLGATEQRVYVEVVVCIPVRITQRLCQSIEEVEGNTHAQGVQHGDDKVVPALILLPSKPKHKDKTLELDLVQFR